MPMANLTVEDGNDLRLKFNDSITNFGIGQEDIYIQIYGSSRSYEFTWTAEFVSSDEVLIDMNIVSPISGTEEIVAVEFPLSNNFKSTFSGRPTNPNNPLYGDLESGGDAINSASFGQTTVYLYLFSVGLTVISSFGGNSMEMMWKFTNTIQLFYFMSFMNFNYPNNLDTFFPYLQFSNADNPYIRSLSSKIVDEGKFDQREVSERIGIVSFYVTNADKLPWLLPVTVLFAIVKISDMKFKSWDNGC